MAVREAAFSGEPGGLDNRIAEFARFLQRQDRSPATVRTYGWGLFDLRDYLASRGVTNLDQITREHLEAWQDRLLASGMRPRSRSLATTAVRQFLKWAADHELCDARLKDWLASIRVKPLKPKPLPPEDLARLLKHFDRPSTQLLARRDRALFFVFLTTGVRVSEGLQLPRTGYERVEVRQKGGSEKLVTVPEHVQAVVREYLAARVDTSAALFVNHPGGERMTSGGVRQVWQRVARDAGVAPFTTHQLRHTFATQLLAQGIDIRVVAELMGHKNLQSIMGYTKVADSAIQEAHRALERVVHPSEQKLPPDPRTLTIQALGKANKPKRRGHPRFRLVR